MLQHYGHTLLQNASQNIAHHGLSPQGTTGIVAVHIPVKVLEAGIQNSFGKGGHDALVKAAYQIGAAPGEPHQGGFHTGDVIDFLLHFQKILKVGLRAGVDGGVVVAGGVNGNGVAFLSHPFD